MLSYCKNKNITPVASVAAIMSSLDGFSLNTSLSLSWLLVSSGAFLKIFFKKEKKKNKTLRNQRNEKTNFEFNL